MSSFFVLCTPTTSPLVFLGCRKGVWGSEFQAVTEVNLDFCASPGRPKLPTPSYPLLLWVLQCRYLLLKTSKYSQKLRLHLLICSSWPEGLKAAHIPKLLLSLSSLFNWSSHIPALRSPSPRKYPWGSHPLRTSCSQPPTLPTGACVSSAGVGGGKVSKK